MSGDNPSMPPSRDDDDDDDDGEEDQLSEDDDAAINSRPYLKQQYRLWLHAGNLPRQGKIGFGRMPSTYAVVETCASGESSSAAVLGQTQVVAHNSNPHWTDAILLEYEYGSKLYFFVHVYLANNSSNNNNNNNKPDPKHLIGTARFEAGDILSTAHHSRVRRLRKGGCVACRLEPPKRKRRGTLYSFATSNGATTMIPRARMSDAPSSLSSFQEQEQQDNDDDDEAPIQYLRFRLAARNLVPRGKHRRSLTNNLFHSMPDTVVAIAKRPHKGSAWVTVYRSQPCQNSLNPQWDMSLLELDTLCHGDMNGAIRISILAMRENRQPSLLGMCETTVRFLKDAGTFRQAQQQQSTNDDDDDGIPEEEDCEGSYFILQRNAHKIKNVGRLVVLEADIVSMDEESGAFLTYREEEENRNTQDGTTIDLANIPVLQPPTLPPSEPSQRNFRQLLQEDHCKINFCVAIDFTSSNGDPRHESSLHYQSESLNDYEESILAVGSAVEGYSGDEQFSVWGFGAKFSPDDPVHHLFQCGASTHVHGVEGILQAYRTVLYSGFFMSGPTVFLNVLQAAAVQAKKQKDQMALCDAGRRDLGYTVLLVCTDGIMDDFEETLRKIQVYESVPLSIIFVGVGRNDFSDLKRLCHSAPQNTTFVGFRSKTTPAEFAHSALRHLPHQISTFMDKHSP